MAAAELGELSGYKARVAEVESSNNPLEVTGNNKGLYQFGPEEMEKYGITDWRDVAQQNIFSNLPVGSVVSGDLRDNNRSRNW